MLKHYQLKDKHPIISLILQRRKLEKLRNTYLEPYSEKEYKGRIHPSLNAWGTRTGRFSSYNPNLHQLPARDEDSKIPKQAIIPDKKGQVFIKADYSQIEYRILAHLSEDQRLIREYNNNPNADFHQLVADTLGISRYEAKTVNFATVYGQSPKALGESLGKTEAEAVKFQARYFSKYPRIKALRDRTIRELKRNKEVISFFGRKRRLPDIDSKKWGLREHTERQAFNFIIQSPATGDLIKLVMNKLDKHIKKCYSGKARLAWQIHDEIVIICDQNVSPQLTKDTQSIMENVIKLKVPLKIDIKIVKRWEEL